MAYATTRIIDKGRNGQVIYEACLCEQHLQTEAPHNLSELEVTPIDPAAKVECAFAHLAPEFRYAGYIDCAKVAAVLLFALLLPTLAVGGVEESRAINGARKTLVPFSVMLAWLRCWLNWPQAGGR